MRKMEMQELKTECLKKVEKVNELKKKLSQKVILRDLNNLKASDSKMTSSNNKNEYFRDKLIITATSTGTLEIIDKRKPSFMWIFDVEYSMNIRLGDAFEYSGDVYTVSCIEESETTDGILKKIEEVVREFDNTSSILGNILNSDSLLDELTYIYNDEHEKLTCNTIQEVIDRVSEREVN